MTCLFRLPTAREQYISIQREPVIRYRSNEDGGETCAYQATVINIAGTNLPIPSIVAPGRSGPVPVRDTEELCAFLADVLQGTRRYHASAPLGRGGQGRS
ncbi:MAG: hypothetical protein KDA57_17700 [Planctomycetales bacterium]|nr:hypothetical protein [Planctomycetales bacterium]